MVKVYIAKKSKNNIITKNPIFAKYDLHLNLSDMNEEIQTPSIAWKAKEI
ncbi:MAG: hypothetical protein LBI26_02050 [Holosporales bacterium]|jgi:hypothetical protein|nr:hypothetical protein [Holosporales bacterium]